MSRVQLEQLNVEGLREVARQQNLDIRGSRAALLNRLTEYFEKNGWPENIINAGPNTEDRYRTEEEAPHPQGPIGGASNNTDRPFSTGSQSTDHLRNPGRNPPTRGGFNPSVQEIVQAVLQALDTNRAQQPQANTHAPRQMLGQSPSPSTDSQANGFQNWNQIKFATKLIPSFAGKEDENVVAWID